MKPKLRRSIPFGALSGAYGYEKLTNENLSLLGSIGSHDSFDGNDGAFKDQDVPAANTDDFSAVVDDKSLAVGSISSVLFSVEKLSISSNDCSYSYSLRSNAIPPLSRRTPSHTEHRGEGGTIDSAALSDLSSDTTTFMSRHSGLDLPPESTSSSATAFIPSQHVMPIESLQTAHEDLSGKGHEKIVSTKLHKQLETTFSSDIDNISAQSDLAARPLPPDEVNFAHERKGRQVRKWLMKLNPFSAPIRSLISPAA